MQLEYDLRGPNTWFFDAMSRKVGCEDQVHFWLDKWVGNARLKDSFPRLFNLSVNKNCKIVETGDWVGENWRWRWNWTRALFSWGEALLQQFQDCLLQVSPVRHVVDSWCWKPDPSRTFSVKSAYKLLMDLEFCLASRQLWMCDVPSKVTIFVWRLLQNRLPTRDLLLTRDILVGVNNAVCVLCSSVGESGNHLFFSCDFSYNVWLDINTWTRAVGPLQNCGVQHFLSFVGCLAGRRFRRGRHVIWMAVVWVLWMTRNKRIFNNGVVDYVDVIASITSVLVVVC